MQIHALTIYDAALAGMLKCSLPPLDTADVSAHLLGPGYVADLKNHALLADVSAHEIKCADYQPRRILGKRFEASSTTDHTWNFTSDTVSFGTLLTLPIFRFLVLATGLPAQAPNKKHLLAFADLAPSGAREVVRGQLEFLPNSEGWLSLSSGHVA